MINAKELIAEKKRPVDYIPSEKVNVLIKSANDKFNKIMTELKNSKSDKNKKAIDIEVFLDINKNLTDEDIAYVKSIFKEQGFKVSIREYSEPDYYELNYTKNPSLIKIKKMHIYA
jgi:uncharacterized protein YcgL (UPF0745 family)